MKPKIKTILMWYLLSVTSEIKCWRKLGRRGSYKDSTITLICIKEDKDGQAMKYATDEPSLPRYLKKLL